MKLIIYKLRGIYFPRILLIYICMLYVIIPQSKALYSISLKQTKGAINKEFYESLSFIQKYINNPPDSNSFLEMNGIHMHQHVLALSNLAAYYGEVQIGEGNKNNTNSSRIFKMLFDTGSCQVWVPSEECKTRRCQLHDRYTPSLTQKVFDSSFNNTDNNTHFHLEYLSGKVEGQLIVEKIILGDLIVPNQVMGIASVLDVDLLDTMIWDGIIGLGYPNEHVLQKNVIPLMDNMINNNILRNKGEKNQFAVYFGKETGEITFGGADMKYKKNIHEEFQWAPIREKKFWSLTILQVKKYDSNDKQKVNYIGDTLKKELVAIIDTGTFLIYGPSDQVKILLKDIKIKENCKNKNLLPNIGFVFKGYKNN